VAQAGWLGPTVGVCHMNRVNSDMMTALSSSFITPQGAAQMVTYTNMH